MRLALPAATVAAALVAGCGPSTSSVDSAASKQRDPGPRLLRAPEKLGEVVLRGDVSPKTAGPYRLEGTYRVRFQQYAPERPRLDFHAETPFVVDLERRQGTPTVRLFRAAAETGARTVRLRGRYYLDVSFGDYPFAIRISPVRR